MNLAGPAWLLQHLRGRAGPALPSDLPSPPLPLPAFYRRHKGCSCLLATASEGRTSRAPVPLSPRRAKGRRCRPPTCRALTREQSGSRAQRPHCARPQPPEPRRAGRGGGQGRAQAAGRGPHAPRHSQRHVRRGSEEGSQGRASATRVAKAGRGEARRGGAPGPERAGGTEALGRSPGWGDLIGQRSGAGPPRLGAASDRATPQRGGDMWKS